MKKDYKDIVFYRTKNGALRWFYKDKGKQEKNLRQKEVKLSKVNKHREETASIRKSTVPRNRKKPEALCLTITIEKTVEKMKLKMLNTFLGTQATM